MNPVLKTYPDGSELTLGMMFGALAISAITTTAIITIQMKLDERSARKRRNNR